MSPATAETRGPRARKEGTRLRRVTRRGTMGQSPGKDLALSLSLTAWKRDRDARRARPSFSTSPPYWPTMPSDAVDSRPTDTARPGPPRPLRAPALRATWATTSSLTPRARYVCTPGCRIRARAHAAPLRAAKIDDRLRFSRHQLASERERERE